VAREKKRLPWIERAFERAGVPLALQSSMDAHFVQIRRNLHDLTPDRILFGGEDIETAIGPLRTHWTPGHSPGHLCLYSPQRKLLFSGDVMLEHITPNISWDPHTDALADFLGSLAGLGELDIDLILPSHGDPFSGHRNWIAETVGHHRERCDQIYGLVSSAPRTAHLLVAELWRKKLSPINHHFAVFEVLAHLEHMQRQGRVHTREHEGALEWRA
jgi:glyoxylase-like metal-dependent hydrolase (beta-lactamase superfamily II)